MKYLVFAFLTCFGQSQIIAQRNSIRFQSGLVHCSFDGTPLFNLENANYDENQFLNASFGVQYQRILKNQIKLQTDFLLYAHSFKTVDQVILFNNQPRNIYETKSKFYTDLQFCFLKSTPLHKTLAFNYGLGPVLRLASYTYWEPQVIPSCFGPPTTNSLDVGINTRAEIAYSPVKWFTIFTQLNFIGFMYRFDDPFGSKPEPLIVNTSPFQFNFPSRFDLSLRLGVGINF